MARRKNRTGRASNPASVGSLERLDVEDLEEEKTITSGQAHDLKVESEIRGVPTRWWLSRMTVEDGETNAVYVEQLIDGSWQDVHQYAPPYTYEDRYHDRYANPRACALPGAMSTRSRDKLPARAFGLPKQRKYPMYRMVSGQPVPSGSHASNAKGRAQAQYDKGALSKADLKKIDRKADKVLAECGVEGRSRNPDPPRKFDLGDRVEIVDDGRVLSEGEVSFHSGYDEWLGQHKYKVLEDDGTRVTFNEDSLRKKRRGKKGSRNPRQSERSSLLQKLSGGTSIRFFDLSEDERGAAEALEREGRIELEWHGDDVDSAVVRLTGDDEAGEWIEWGKPPRSIRVVMEPTLRGDRYTDLEDEYPSAGALEDALRSDERFVGKTVVVRIGKTAEYTAELYPDGGILWNRVDAAGYRRMARKMARKYGSQTRRNNPAGGHDLARKVTIK